MVKTTLEQARPDLIKEWHWDKNYPSLPSDFSACSGKKVWWKCLKGHEWESKISNRFNNRNCPYCSHNIVAYENSLSYLNPKLAKLWSDKNILSPDEVSISSGRRVWWKCSIGHEWQATVASLNRPSYHCPFCFGRRVCLENCLATKEPELVKQWHPTKNTLTPFDITCGSKKEVWWICSKFHEWEATIKSRVRGSSCPFCSGHLASMENCIATIFPNLINEWNFQKNTLTPYDYTASSGEKVWWKCSLGHEWKAIISNRTKSRAQCPYCAKKYACNENCLANVANLKLISEWHPSKNTKTLYEITPYSKQLIWWQCSKDKTHEWQATPSNRYGSEQDCPFCCNTHTKLERFFTQEFGFTKFNKTVLKNKNYRPDFKITEELFVNVDGLYWHNEKNKGKRYHLNLREAFEAENKRLLQFYEDEIYNKPKIVESIINIACGSAKQEINAKYCDIKNISLENTCLFVKENSLIDFSSFKNNLGMFYNNELVATLSYDIYKKQHIRIKQISFKLNTVIKDGLLKFLEYLNNCLFQYNLKTISLECDLRYINKKIYEEAGFSLKGIKLSWCWTNGKKRYSKFYNENAIIKMVKLYDAGQAQYIKYLKE